MLLLLATGSSLFAQTKNKKASPVDRASMERGKVVYEQYCLVCHQADGSGVQSLNPPLIKTQWVLGDKTELISILLNGLDKEIDVNGDVYANVMPSQAHLTDAEIADVLTYVRNSFSNQASAIRSAEVAKARAANK
jgi:mono/diheme cytochrome c family protein